MFSKSTRDTCFRFLGGDFRTTGGGSFLAEEPPGEGLEVIRMAEVLDEVGFDVLEGFHASNDGLEDSIWSDGTCGCIDLLCFGGGLDKGIMWRVREMSFAAVTTFVFVADSRLMEGGFDEEGARMLVSCEEQVEVAEVAEVVS